MLDDRPEIFDDLLGIWDSFWELNMRRVAVYEYQPISISEVAAWLDINGIDDIDARAEHLRLIGALDSAWLSYMRSNKKEK